MDIDGTKRTVRVLLVGCMTALMLGSAAGAGAEEPDLRPTAPPEAQAFAEEFFPGYVVEDWESGVTVDDASPEEEASRYHFDYDGGAIEVGTVLPTHHASAALLEGELGASLMDRLDQRPEWIVALHQDGTPRNVAGVWQPDDEAWEMATLGYGQRLAEQLDTLEPDEHLLFEAPLDAFYAVNEDTVRPLSGDLPDFEPMTWEAYAERLSADVKAARNLEGDDMVGGAYTAAPDGGLSTPVAIGSSMAGMLLLTAAVLLWRRRDRPTDVA